MTIYLATDHAGFELKNHILAYLQGGGKEVVDCGAYAFNKDDDFPDFIIKAAAAVQADPSNTRAIILGGSGQGEAMLANRFSEVRASVYYGGALDIITLSREHNDANILSLGARFLSEEEAVEAIDLWLSTKFLGKKKYQCRIDKITKPFRP